MPMFKDFPKAKDTPSSDIVGTIRTGKMDTSSNTPYSLDTFRFTADHPDITAKLAKLYGGKPGEWETKKPDKYELISETSGLLVEVKHFDSEFILWGANKPMMAKPRKMKMVIHVCARVTIGSTETWLPRAKRANPTSARS
jgi:hypothetical protein